MNLRTGKARGGAEVKRARADMEKRRANAGMGEAHTSAGARKVRAFAGTGKAHALADARSKKGRKRARVAVAFLVAALVAGCGAAAGTAMARGAGAMDAGAKTAGAAAQEPGVAAADGSGTGNAAQTQGSGAKVLATQEFSVKQTLAEQVDTTGAAWGKETDWLAALAAFFTDAELADTGKRVRTKATLVDAKRYTAGQTIDDLMENPETAASAFLTQLEWKSTLYEFGDEDYYAAKLDLPREGGICGAAVDSAFAYDNYDGQVVGGVVYDARGGIAYVPKAAVDDYAPADETREQGCAMQAQLLFTADATQMGTTVAGVARVVNTATGEASEAAAVGSLGGNELFVQLADTADASKVDPQTISVTVNDGAAAVAGTKSGADTGAGGGAGTRAGDTGSQESGAGAAMAQADATVAGYDARTGVLGVAVPAAAAAKVEVQYAAANTDVPAPESALATLMSSAAEMECVPGVEFGGLDLDRIGEGWEWGAAVYVDAEGAEAFDGRDGDHVYYPTPLDGVAVSQQTWDAMGSGSNFERIGQRYPSGSRIAYNMSFLVAEDEGGNMLGSPSDMRAAIANGWTAKRLRISAESADNPGITSLDWSFLNTAEDGQAPSVRMFSAICTHGTNPFSYEADGGICTAYTKAVAIDREASTITLAFMAKLGGDNGGQTCSQVARFRVKKIPKKGWVELQKRSANEGITNGNACYGLGGAVYGIYSDEGCANLVAELATDGNGYAKSGELDIGQYWVREISASTGYALDVQAHGVEVKGDETSRVDSAQTAPNNPMGLVVRKVDDETGKATAQGSASLAGAEFTVKYYDGYYEKDSLPKAATRSWVLKTDEGGQARLDDAHKASGNAFYLDSAGRPCLPLGTVSVQETRAPDGYLLGDAEPDVQQIRGKGARASDETIEVFNAPTVPNKVKRGGVEVFKHDAELGASEALGGHAHDAGDKEHSSLAGIAFTITNKSARNVRVDGVDYGPGKVVKTIETAWDEERRSYRAATGLDCLPFGEYEIAEAATNRSYLLSDGKARAFQIREDGAFASFSNVFSNRVARNDLRFQKKGEGSSEALAHVPFALVNEATGETHVLVTDGNGSIDTANGLALHSTATNAFDVLLAQGGTDGAGDGGGSAEEDANESAADGGGAATDGDAAAPSLEAVKELVSSGARITNAAIDAAGEPGRVGTWFGRGEGGGWAPADDARCALPYGSYLLYELPCEANEGYQLFSTQVSVYADVSVYARGYDLGTIVDYRSPQPPTLHTTATDAGDGDKFVVEGDAARIVDTVAYGNLEPGQSYRLEGVLMDKATGETVRDADGEELAAVLEFEAPVTDGHVEVAFDVDTSGFAGHELVVFETLFCGEAQIAAHEDLDSASQTVRVVSLQTRLAHVEEHVEEAANGETPGGKTADNGGGEEGNANAENQNIEAGGENGANEGDAGKAEDVEDEMADEAGKSDEGDAEMTQEQEQAQEEADGQADKLLEAGAHVTLVDTVAYRGFAPGQSCTVAGVLMDKETGEPVRDADGEEVRGETSFTAQEGDGTVEVAFDLDTAGLAGKEIVAFETASDEQGATIVEHADLSNEAQTVRVKDEPVTPPEEPESPAEPAESATPAADAPETAEEVPGSTPASGTGDAARRMLLVAVAAAAAANLAYLYASRKRKQACSGQEGDGKRS